MKIRKFQQGGPMPEETQAPAQAQTQASPEQQLQAMAAEIIKSLGPEASAMLAQVIMLMLQSAAPQQGAPAFARKGGKLVQIGRK